MTNQLTFDKPSAQVFATATYEGLIIAGNFTMGIPREAIMRYARSWGVDAAAGSTTKRITLSFPTRPAKSCSRAPKPVP